MLAYVYSIILGVVQGIAEFLPISSSGHLVIVGELLKRYSAFSIEAENATMNVALHFGSLMSIAVVYWKDLLDLRQKPKLIAMIILATIPVGLVGVLLKDHIESLFNKPIYAGCALLATAGMLMAGRKFHHSSKAESEVSSRTALIVGLFQAVAIIPGISRSGSTIAGGLLCGLKRPDAARFSFLIALPAIGGATVLQLKDFVTGEEQIDSNLLPIVVGTLVSFVVGVFCIRWLIKLVVADRLHWFAIYCILAGLSTIVWQLSIA